MQDWQIAVLNSENIRVDQDQRTGYKGDCTGRLRT